MRVEVASLEAFEPTKIVYEEARDAHLFGFVVPVEASEFNMITERSCLSRDPILFRRRQSNVGTFERCPHIENIYDLSHFGWRFGAR